MDWRFGTVLGMAMLGNLWGCGGKLPAPSPSSILSATPAELASATRRPAPPLNWTPYSASDGSFSGEFPFPVKTTSAKSMALKGVVFSTYEARDVQSGQDYIVHLTTYSQDSLARKMSARPADMLRNSLPDEGEVRFESLTQIAGNPTLKFSGDFEGRPTCGLTVMTGRGHRIFAVWASGGSDSDVARFLSAFRPH